MTFMLNKIKTLSYLNKYILLEACLLEDPQWYQGLT